ncbi:hypothetical protein [Mesobacillus harenae]|nr:hypothetical protein [Mesobacillus harenae]
MNKTETTGNQELFYNLLKKTYEKGTTDKEITVQKVLEDLRLELQTIYAE